jgi:hypothetical protein
MNAYRTKIKYSSKVTFEAFSFILKQLISFIYVYKRIDNIPT